MPPANRRSPLALVLLGVLTQGPQNAYRMQRFLIATDKDKVVNIGSRNSIYQSLERLERDGLIAVHDRAGRDSTVYELTESGWGTLQSWLTDTMSTPREEYPAFPAALSTASLLTPAQCAELLERRRGHLDEALGRPTPDRMADAHGIERIFLLEDEYQRAMLTAERDWLDTVIAELRSGALSWTAVRWQGPVG
ncbi:MULTISPECIES: PadR family transcriptional regulator [unclassified Nocardia]|uniref:PadR family transcriptional regulator n=1 Tax=unclassified Nocardia TaxID=2637762 RepID=UPI001CE47BC3|nr:MULTISPECIES: PadR family transcriptional regulator [unclassified Nocardia]